MTKKTLDAMTLAEFMDRPQKNRGPRSVLFMRIPGGGKTTRLFRYLFHMPSSKPRA